MVETAGSVIEKYISETKKAQKNRRNEELIREADSQKAEAEEIEVEAESIESIRAKASSQFNFVIDMILLILNPILVKNHITPLTNNELIELKNAIIPLISPAVLKSTEKLSGVIQGVPSIKKIYTMFKAIWKILRPRFAELKKFLKTKKKDEDTSADE